MTDIRKEKARLEVARLDRKFREEDERQLAADLVTIFGTETGRRFLLRLMDWTGVFIPTTPDMTDRQVAMSEGARAVGLRIMGAVNKEAPDALRKAHAERADILQERNRLMDEVQKELSAAIDAARQPKKKE